MINKGYNKEMLIKVGYNETLPVIKSNIRITNSTFENYLDFSNVQFDSSVEFSKATFNSSANFSGTTFNSSAEFPETTFNGSVQFMHVTFNGDAKFHDATFYCLGWSVDNKMLTYWSLNFNDATFNKDADFIGATFNSFTFFSGVTFNNSAEFSWTTFNDNAYFDDGLTFNGYNSFQKATFKSYAYFSNVIFNQDADFLWTIFNNNAFFSEVTFNNNTGFWKLPDASENIFTDMKTCEVFRKSYINEARYTDADNIYYNFRKKSMDDKGISFSKFTDYLSWVTCGFGTKLHFTLLAIAFIIITFTIIYRNPGLYLCKHKKNIPSIIFYWREPGIYRSSEEDKKEKSKVSFWECFCFSINTFTRLGTPNWHQRDKFWYAVTIEGVLGWIMLAIFLATLMHLLIRP